MIRKHVMNDLRPYVCTFLDCDEAGKTYASRRAFRTHERSAHGFKEYLRTSQRGLPKSCIFCEEVLSIADKDDWVTWYHSSRHVARHMEEIAFTVVTKPYEDWDFYSDASSVENQGTHNPRNTTASYDAKRDEDTTYQAQRMQRLSCDLCTEKKTFRRADALRRHMLVVHPGSI